MVIQLLDNIIHFVDDSLILDLGGVEGNQTDIVNNFVELFFRLILFLHFFGEVHNGGTFLQHLQVYKKLHKGDTFKVRSSLASRLGISISWNKLFHNYFLRSMTSIVKYWISQ